MNESSPNTSTSEYLWCAAFSLEAVCIILTNSITIATFQINKHLRKRSTYLLINLSVADLLVGVLPLPLYIYFLGIAIISPDKLSNHSVVYNIYQYLDIFTGLASITSLAFISLERMLATVWPLRHRVTPFRNYICVIIATWVLAACVAALTTYFNSYYSQYAVYAAWIPFSFLLSSLFIIIISYSVVFANFRACRGRSVRATRTLGQDKNRRLAKTLLIVSTASFIAWSPFVIITGIHYYSYLYFSKTVLYVTKLLHYMNSLINTVIYASRMAEFRIALIQLICRCSRTRLGTKPKPTSFSMSNLGNPLLFGMHRNNEHNGGLLFVNHRRSTALDQMNKKLPDSQD